VVRRPATRRRSHRARRRRCEFQPRGWAAATLIHVPGIWRDLELGAPDIARLGTARLNGARVALLGTLRRDGSPRISPVEPYFAAGHLLVGPWPGPERQPTCGETPRYVLHSAVTGPDTGEGELKLYGSAVEAGQKLRDATAAAWWQGWPVDKAIVFSLHIEQAVFIDWDTAHGLMTVHQWSAGSGYSRADRTYP
jgi:hypothetical protein